MFGIFMESLVIFKLYTGLKLLLALTLFSWGYLLFTEKERRNRLLLIYAPFLIILLFLFPVSRWAFVAAGLDGETYYRILWTIPMGVITVYGFCRLFAAHRRIGTVAGAALIMLCGRYVYQSEYISRAENLYHIPDTVIEICDRIEPDDPDKRVWAVMPPELIHFVRQYSRETLQDPLACGLTLTDEIDGYRIYEDPVAKEEVEGWQDYYEDNV